MEALFNNISRYIQLTAEEQELISRRIAEKTFKRKQLLLQEGDICKHSYFVKSGCLRGYTIDKDGTEHNIVFAPQGWWIADMYSLITAQPGQLFIETTSNATVQLLSRHDQEELFILLPKLERFFRILTENALVSNQQRIIDNLSLSAQDRYQRFCERYAGILEHISQKQIASYIGVTPEFLSRMIARKEEP